MTATSTLELSKLVPAPYNSRQAVGDGLGELAASIKVDGVLEPLLVRRHPKRSGKFEIIAGHRRAAASKAAGLAEVPVIVLDVDTKTARRICATENLQREDLHPLEEARAIQNLVDDVGVAKAAAEVGKSIRYVARRANLLRLSKRWQRAIVKDARYQAYPAAVLDELALLAEPDQDQVLARFRYESGVPTVESIRELVSDYLRTLKRATWKLDDAELVPKQGACVDCTRHSRAALGLFEDEVEKLSDATCRDSACWDEKRDAAARRALDAARAEHGEVLVLIAGGWDGDRSSSSRNAKALGKPDVLQWDYQAAKKGAKGAVPAFVVEGKGRGRVRWVTVTKGRSSGARRAKPAAAKAKPGSAADLKAKRERLKRRRDGRLVDLVRERVEGVEAYPRDVADLLALVAAYGIGERTYSFSERSRKAAKDPVATVWISVRARMTSALVRHAASALASQVREAKWVLETLWPDEAKAVRAELEAKVREEIPKPKSLERLEARGRKVVKPAAAKKRKKAPRRSRAARAKK